MYRLLRLLGLCFLLFGSLFSQAFADEASPQDILSIVDKYRLPQKPFTLSSHLVEFKNGKQSQSLAMKVFSTLDAQTHHMKTMVRFLKPLKDSGKLMLKSDSDIWLFDPNGKSTIRISPQQRLIGQASNGDVVSVNLASQYKPVPLGIEMITDGSNSEVEALSIQLDRLSPHSYYFSGKLWVDTDNHKPIKLNFYSESGVLVKSMYFRKFKPFLGHERASELVIFDGLNPKWITLISYSNFEESDIPMHLYQKNKMNSFSIK